ncbi:MAG: hypothetical protein OJI67_23240, partial [Prosthecobacter sp.]|nr:hypothetical protein [Prosthecobacter sp.]
PAPSRKPLAVPSTDPNSVIRKLKNLKIRGANREKVATLRDEATKMKVVETPHAFCFLLRSIFETSAKAYCIDHNLSYAKSNGKDRTLLELLDACFKHLTNNRANALMDRKLYGAMVELGKSDGIFSVTSMNQLIHHPTFSHNPRDISTLFISVFPMIEEMNA